jgi:hypothetical protein
MPNPDPKGNMGTAACRAYARLGYNRFAGSGVVTPVVVSYVSERGPSVIIQLSTLDDRKGRARGAIIADWSAGRTHA